MEEKNQDDGSLGRTTQMLMQMISQLSEQLQNNQARQLSPRTEREVDREEMKTQIRVGQSSAMPPATLEPPPPASADAVWPEFPRNSTPSIMLDKKKPTLPEPPRFEGTRLVFRTWLCEMKNKLRVDGGAIGSRADQFAYIYARLGDAPQQMTVAFVEAGGSDGTSDPGQYLRHLEMCYGDPNAGTRAMEKLRSIRQRDNESFATFLPRFEREIADSGGMSWPEHIKISYLEGALNRQIRLAAVHLDLECMGYSTWIQTLQTISSRLDRLYREGKKRGEELAESSNQEPTHGQREPAPPATAWGRDRMNWKSTAVGKHSSRRTKERNSGVHPAKDVRKCFRCDEVGHAAAYCTRGSRAQPADETERPRQRMKAAKFEPGGSNKEAQDGKAGNLYETATNDGSENE
ncbi:hypothetical protein PCL_10546 [Purpureocillium lilacinum]|uniref:CCHC-type domain-containing protein n=1 Tax=Purpureocillium lilacinum TaxID=33203 RepID=A0A2U3DQ20_PURLI|nr:hypothetical protein PCL_10546 [Purpureocillium lilacinum]